MLYHRMFIAEIRGIEGAFIGAMPVADLRSFVITWQTLVRMETISRGEKFASATIKVDSISAGTISIDPWCQDEHGKCFGYRELLRLVKDYNTTIIPECGEQELELKRVFHSLSEWELTIPNLNLLPCHQQI